MTWLTCTGRRCGPQITDLGAQKHTLRLDLADQLLHQPHHVLRSLGGRFFAQLVAPSLQTREQVARVVHEDPLKQLASPHGGYVMEHAGQHRLTGKGKRSDLHRILRAGHAFVLTTGKRALPGGRLVRRLRSENGQHGAAVTAMQGSPATTWAGASVDAVQSFSLTLAEQLVAVLQLEPGQKLAVRCQDLPVLVQHHQIAAHAVRPEPGHQP